MPPERALEALETLADLLADRVVARLREPAQGDLIRQDQSPAGARRFASAARRGDLAGAVRIGRTWHAPREAHAAWLAALGQHAPERADSPVAELERELRLVAGGAR